VIEQLFGITKKEFKMFHEPTYYSMDTQAKIILAITVICNFICHWDYPSTPHLDELEGDDTGGSREAKGDPHVRGVLRAEQARADARCDRIASAM
jgi:hypothetical protein